MLSVEDAVGPGVALVVNVTIRYCLYLDRLLTRLVTPLRKTGNYERKLRYGQHSERI